MQPDISIEVGKVILLLLMFAVAGAATYLTILLNKLIRPISRQLIELHKGDSSALHTKLHSIKQRYISLLPFVENIDAAEFSAGEIERLSIRFLGREVTAAAAHSWIHQAPGILISFGLLGTFWGLTVGLGQISGAVAPGASPQQTMTALSAIVAPMGTAFETSLVGLLLSIIVLIFTQLTGARTCLERCESLLSSWLETVLPQELGDKLMTPLKKSINGLNETVKLLPMSISSSVEQAMQAAFAEKLAKMFNVSTTIAVEAQQATRQLSAVASTLNESGQDFVMAATAFRQSNFPAALMEAVNGLLESKERLSVSSDGLSVRMQEVRDGLLAIQAEWQLLARSAQNELETCRVVTQQVQQGMLTLQASSQTLVEGVEVASLATKQLKETRLEVMRDRNLAIDVAKSVRDRLAVDSSAVETCQVFAAALETSLTKWNNSVEQLDTLRQQFIQTTISGRADEQAQLQELAGTTESLIKSINTSLTADLDSAISLQREAIGELSEPMTRAQKLTIDLIQQLETLQAQMVEKVPDQPRPGFWGLGGQS